MLDHKRQKANDHSAQLQELKAQLNELRSTKLRIETNLQQRVRLEQTKDEMEKTNDALESEIRVSFSYDLFLCVCDQIFYAYVMLMSY